LFAVTQTRRQAHKPVHLSGVCCPVGKLTQFGHDLHQDPTLVQIAIAGAADVASRGHRHDAVT
jgi:hypothetical protein